MEIDSASKDTAGPSRAGPSSAADDKSGAAIVAEKTTKAPYWAGADKSKQRFEIKKYNAVALWAWGTCERPHSKIYLCLFEHALTANCAADAMLRA